MRESTPVTRPIPISGSIRRQTGRILFCFLTIALTFFLAGCGEKDSGNGEADGAAAQGDSAASDTTAQADKPEKQEKAIRVDVGEVVRSELVVPIFADGVIRTPRSVEIRTKIAGELTKVAVQDGDRVRKGQLLAQIDQRQYILALDESRYRHFQALSQVAVEDDTFTVDHQAVTDFARKRQDLDDMRRDGRLSREEYQAKLLELEMTSLQEGAFRQEVFEQRTGLAEARMAEERAKLDLENTEIRAPFSGVVQALQVVPGEIVSTGSPICAIYNNDRLEAVVNVLEADLGNLVEQRPALLVVPATGDTLQTFVDVISPSLDQTSRTCDVIIRFDNPEGKYRPGMFVRAEIAGWIYPDRLLVPKAAVLMRDNRPLVFKVVEDYAQWLYVDTGLENDSWFEILKVHSGGSLAPGERVVVSDHLTLAHEAKIKVRRTRPTESRWAFALSPAGSTQ